MLSNETVRDFIRFLKPFLGANLRSQHVPVSGGQFSVATFMGIIRKGGYFGPRIIPVKGVFDRCKQGNRLGVFLNRYEHSFLSKRRCKGNTVEHGVVANLPWTDSYEKIAQNYFRLKIFNMKGVF